MGKTWNAYQVEWESTGLAMLDLSVPYSALFTEEKIPAVTLSGHSDRVTAVAFSPDGQRVASGSNDNTVRLWALMAPTPINQLTDGLSLDSWLTSVLSSAQLKKPVALKALTLRGLHFDHAVFRVISFSLFAISSLHIEFLHDMF